MKFGQILLGGFIFFLSILVGVFVGLHRDVGSKVPGLALLEEKLEPPDFVKLDPYYSNIQSVFTSRCVACHACYNGPCQLNLGSFEGFERGASKQNPYDFPLVTAQPPTRLGIDATSISGWRKKGFFAVHGITAKLLSLPAPAARTAFVYDAELSRICPSPRKSELADYLKVQPSGGMPYGFPKLNTEESARIQNWLASGAKGPSPEAASWFENPQTSLARRSIAEWEKILNGPGLKTALSARYFFEHLFAAHIAFSASGQEFFRLVRAKNEQGLPVEIPAVRPFDDPGPRFFYRFKKVSDVIVAKTHTVFVISDTVRDSFERDFLNTEWLEELDRMPPYGNQAANAFVTFRAIPRQARYRFFLDHARYFIMTFIKGPVCRGQTALNVIDDHFWVMFLDPRFDQSAKDTAAVAQIEKLLNPPASVANKFEIFSDLRENRWRANVLKTKLYEKAKVPFETDAIWDGEKSNPNALLTVYRHFDSADVRWGAEGEDPKTVWVMDYQIFEDVYYNLVAGYNVFGPVLHQLETRLYMEISRIASQDNFLTFLPKSGRPAIRRLWSHDGRRSLEARFTSEALSVFGQSAQSKMAYDYVYPASSVETNVVFQTPHFQNEFLRKVFTERLASQVAKKPELISHQAADTLQERRSTDYWVEELRQISGVKGAFAVLFPDLSILRIRMKSGSTFVYSIIHNKAHANVNLLFFESLRREPENDTLNFVPGFAAAYPNYYFDVAEDEIKDFVALVRTVGKSPLSDDEVAELESSKKISPRLDAVTQRFGISRHRDSFWELHDWFNAKFREIEPLEAGLLDLNRYLNDN